MFQPVEHWLQVVRGELLETTGLRLTLVEASRRWNVEQYRLVVILSALARVGFLLELPDGSYVYRHRGSQARTRELKKAQ